MPRAIAQDLHFDVAGALHQRLQVDRAVAKGRLRLLARGCATICASSSGCAPAGCRARRRRRWL